MNANLTLTRVFNGNHRRGSAIALAAAIALYSLAATPATANPGVEVMPPAPRHHVPSVQPLPHNPAIFNNAVSAVTNAIRNAKLDVPGGPIKKTKKDEEENPKEDRVKKNPKKGCTVPECEKKVSDIEKEFLGSDDGKDAKKKLAEAKKIRDKKLKDAQAELDAKIKAKLALNDDDYACCVYTPE